MGDWPECHLTPVPQDYCGLWERTLIERAGVSEAGAGQRERVFWLQTGQWHADLRIPNERPAFAGVATLDACNDAQLAFIARQEAFCGLTKVDGRTCTWLRLHDLRPGTALDAGHMAFRDPDFIVETGIAGDYLEHWQKVGGSDGTCAMTGTSDHLLLRAGRFSMRVRPRRAAPVDADPYAPIDKLGRAQLVWRASLEITLFDDDRAVLSTHPWIEGEIVQAMNDQVARCA